MRKKEEKMKAFTVYTGKVVCILNDNIDTDILIPKNYLKSVKRTGFGDFVFAPWRYDKDGNKVADFALNQEKYADASILITGENFGCGSSREHAAWALQDYGIRVVIAGGYSDIFYNNWLSNGNVAIKLDSEKRKMLSELTDGKEVKIDLVNQKIIFKDLNIDFDFPAIYKQRLIEGKDAIDLTLDLEDKIKEYENRI